MKTLHIALIALLFTTIGCKEVPPQPTVQLVAESCLIENIVISNINTSLIPACAPDMIGPKNKGLQDLDGTFMIPYKASETLKHYTYGDTNTQIDYFKELKIPYLLVHGIDKEYFGMTLNLSYPKYVNNCNGYQEDKYPYSTQPIRITSNPDGSYPDSIVYEDTLCKVTVFIAEYYYK